MLTHRCNLFERARPSPLAGEGASLIAIIYHRGPPMKPASSALVTYLAALRGQNDATLLMADCFTFTLQSGLILTYTNIDVPVSARRHNLRGQFRARRRPQIPRLGRARRRSAADHAVGHAGRDHRRRAVPDRLARRRFRRLPDFPRPRLFQRQTRRHRDRQRHSVHRAARHRRRSRPHKRQSHRPFRSHPARRVDAAQSLPADLRAHAL